MALTRIKTNQITDLAVTTAKLAANSVTSAKLENNLTYGSDFTVSGNLTVSGTTTSVSTTNTRVEDAIIALSAEATGSASVDSGLLINRGADDNQAMIWDESADQFIFANVGAEDGDTAGNVTISSYAGVQAGAIVYGSLNDGTTTLTATVAELNALDGITSSVSELNILDGVTADATEINTLDGITSSTAELNILTGVTSTAAEINLTDGSSAGTIVNSKAVIYGASGEVNATTLQVGGVSITSTPAELNILDGATLDVTELNYVDGVTSSIQTQLDAKLALAGGTMSGNIAMGTNSITGMADPSSAQDAATKAYVDTADALKLNLSGGTMSGAIAMGTNAITGMADPSSAQDAATKAYVDSQVSAGSTFSIAGDSGTDNVTVGTDTMTFSGTANEVTTAVTNNTLTIGLPSDVNISNDLTVAGNLTVSGTTTTLSTTNSVVSDSLIELNSGAGSNANDLGLIFERGSTGDNAVFAWDESADKFTLGTTTATGASTGDLTITSGTLVAALEGNASTATALETARNIAIAGDQVGTASFDGSGDITITVATQNDSVDLGTHTTGNYVATIADAGNSAITVVNGTAEGGAVTLDIAANAVALGTQTTGNYVATIADAGSGRITVANSGTENAAITLDIAANAVTMGTHTAGDYVATITGGAGIASTGATSGETIAHTLSVDLTDTNVFNSDGTVSTAVVLDGSGDFTANAITTTNIDGILGANTAAAATVTTLDASGLASLDGGIDVDGAFVVANTSGNISTTGTAIIGSATATAGATLKVDSTDSMMIPVGTTGERPTGAAGMFRFNSTVGGLEYYDGSAWDSVSSDFTLASSQTFNGDDSTTAFTLSSLTGADSYTVAGVLVMLNGVVQEPTTVYGISGTTLTFTTAPATGDLIEVRKFTTTTTVVAIADSDGDTQVQVEEGADDDTIRFDVQGVEKAYLNSTGLVVGGNIHATGTITADGDITLGDASSDTVTFTAKVGSNIVPTADSTYDLGSDPASSGQAWANVYADTYYGDGSNLTGIDATQILNGTSNVQVASNADITITRGGTLSATFTAAGMTGDVIGNVTGSADTLTTARAIEVSGAVTGTANFDGSAAINIVTTATSDPTLTLAGDLSGSATFTNLGNATLTATIAANSVALGTDTTGNYVAAGATSGSGISGSVSSEGGTFTVTSNATSSNTGNTIVFRDGSGNFSAGVITGTSTAARYADLAEMYAADEAIEPGTVVHFAGDGKVAACDIANCRAVAGIISTDPAHLMNSDQEGVALALAGRVPCKVTGPVAAGDLMVSAGNGMAMANNEAAMGTVIGKAIEANEGGEGIIEVLALMM